MTDRPLKTTIAIIGCGDVGSTLAYTLLQNPICSEVILVDPKKALLEAQVRDLGDATYGGRSATRVRAGTHKEAGQADIVVVTAGAKQKTGQCDFTNPPRVGTMDSIIEETINIHKLLCLVPSNMNQANPAFLCSHATCTSSLQSSMRWRLFPPTQFCFSSLIQWIS